MPYRLTTESAKFFDINSNTGECTYKPGLIEGSYALQSEFFDGVRVTHRMAKVFRDVLPEPIFDGVLNTSLLNGSSQYFNLGDVLNFSGDFSWCGWIYNDSAGAAAQRVFDRYNTGVTAQYRCYLDTSADTLNFLVQSAGGSSQNVSISCPIDQWVFFSCIHRDGVEVEISVNDGTPAVQAYVSGVGSATGTDTAIGVRASNTSQYYEGGLSTFTAYSAALTPAQITELYNIDEVLCYDNLSAGIKTNMELYLPLENHIGFVGQELIDQHTSGNDATNVGGIPFADAGLTMVCV